MAPVVTWMVGAMALVQAGMSFASPDIRNAILTAYAVIPQRIEALAAAGDWAGAAAPLIGHAFLHAGWVHLFFNAMILLMAGEVVTARYGRGLGGAVRYLGLFTIAAVGGALAYIAINPQSGAPAVGASGAACGLFAGYLLGARADWRAALRDPAVLRGGAYFLLANVGLAALARVSGVLPIAWEAHLGGFVAGALAYPLLLPRQTALMQRGPWG